MYIIGVKELIVMYLLQMLYVGFSEEIRENYQRCVGRLWRGTRNVEEAPHWSTSRPSRGTK